jgi:hypothetical protein
MLSETWLWAVGLIAAIVFFAVVESYAIDYPNNQWTLSKAIATLGAKWPLSIWICGAFAGGLAVHFFWHWCDVGPDGIPAAGGFFLAVLGYYKRPPGRDRIFEAKCAGGAAPE